MRLGFAVTLYTALAVLANPVGAADWSAVEALREGDMKKLAFSSEPSALPDIAVMDAADAPRSLADYRGEWMVLNFWATWCAPCRKEMPTLAALQERFAAAPLSVVTVATGRNSPAAIRRFFDEIGVETLPEYRDPKQELARAMGILGLPITLIVDPEGREVARLPGDALWDSDSAVAILEALIEGGSQAVN